MQVVDGNNTGLLSHRDTQSLEVEPARCRLHEDIGHFPEEKPDARHDEGGDRKRNDRIGVTPAEEVRERRDPMPAEVDRALDVAALLVGVMRAAADFSRAYAQQRVAFGKPIAHHQALAFLITDMASAVEATRLLVHEAACALDRGDDAAERCATAFVEAAEQALFVTPNAVQILGGHGFMQDYPVEKWMRDARALGLWLGGVDAARDDAGADVVASDAPLALVGAAP